jgi:hypothetical protein
MKMENAAQATPWRDGLPAAGPSPHGAKVWPSGQAGASPARFKKKKTKPLTLSQLNYLHDFWF